MDRQLQKQQKQQKGGHHRRDKRDSGYDSTDDSSSDDGDDGGTNRAGGSLAHLLKRIRRPASTHGDMDVSDDDDGTKTGSDDDEGEEGEEEVDASSSDDTESDDGMDDVSHKEDFDDVASTSTDGIFQDPYEAHFSKPSLPQLDSLPSDGKSIQQQIIPYIGNSRKVAIGIMGGGGHCQKYGCYNKEEQTKEFTKVMGDVCKRAISSCEAGVGS